MAETGRDFEAESIIARRRQRGKVEYLVRWKGLSSEEDSWKQYAELPLAKSLIKQFLANFRRASTDSENSLAAAAKVDVAATTAAKSQNTPKNGPKTSAPRVGASKSKAAKQLAPSNSLVATRPKSKRLAVTQRPRLVPTKVTEIAKKVVQRSTRTLQKVSNMNNLQALGTPSRARTVAGARSTPARPKSRANRAPAKGNKAKSGNAVTRQRAAPSHAAKPSKPPAKKTASAKSSPSSSPGSQAKSASSSKPKISSSKPVKAVKRSSLPQTGKSKKGPVVPRTSKSLSPQPKPKAAATNPRKRKLKLNHSCGDDSSDDNDVLYSLVEDVKPPKAKQAKVGGFTELHRLLVHPDSKAGREAKKSADGSGTSRGSSARGTPDSDPEISFKQMHSPGRRLLLKDSVKKSKKSVETVPRSQSPLPTMASAAVAHTPGTGAATTYKLSPGNPSQALTEPNPAPTVDSMDDLPHVPVIPVLPGSPAAASYKSLVKNISSSLQPRGLKKKGSGSNGTTNGEAEPVVERRTSVRQSESAFRYKDIVVRKFPGYTQIWLFSQTKLKNAFNPKVFQELIQALHNAKFDDSRLVMLSGSGSIFSSGLDLHYLTSSAEDHRTSAKNMADAVREFASTLLSFPKPIVAAVNGPAIGLGAAILPLCDIIYASDKASFYCPYARLCQTPECCSSFTFPQVMGMAVGNEMLLAGRKLTAIEAYENGLVSQVFWPTSMMQEVVPRVQNMAAFSAKSMEASKVLVRSHQRAKLQLTLDTECQLLAERWASSECQKAILAYLEDEQDLLA